MDDFRLCQTDMTSSPPFSDVLARGNEDVGVGGPSLTPNLSNAAVQFRQAMIRGRSVVASESYEMIEVHSSKNEVWSF